MRFFLAVTLLSLGAAAQDVPRRVDFVRDVQPIFAAKCIECHGAKKQKGGYRLDARGPALRGGDLHDNAIRPHDSGRSPLLYLVTSKDADVRMPRGGDELSVQEIEILRAWIDQGADWPESASVDVKDPRDWWSLKPLVRPAVPQSDLDNPIDVFVVAKLSERKLAMSPSADRRTLIRRVYFDLTGLPPSPEEVDAFVADSDPRAYEALVDRLLASPRHAERWARHWLDVVHFGETHGYDKDQPRPNAWPYRDYVIRAFHADKPYREFVQEQVAGDVLAHDPLDGAEALGFLAAGPWDLIGHAEVPETKIDGKVARHLDRDDIVSNTIGTFCSLTVHCAQCHNHKFDPIPQEDYYRLQSVFAAIDRTDVEYDRDPAVGARRKALAAEARDLRAKKETLEAKVRAAAAQPLVDLEARITAAEAAVNAAARPEFGYHSEIAASADTEKWVQVDLGSVTAIDSVVLAPCHDDFNGIGDGFGFPRQFRIEVCDAADFATGHTTVVVSLTSDQPNPGIAPQTFLGSGLKGRYVRVTATRLAERKSDYIFALAELRVLRAGENVAAGVAVTALDSIEMAPRWARVNLVDGYAPSAATGAGADLSPLRQQRSDLLAAATEPAQREEQTATDRRLNEVTADLASLPPAQIVYAGAVHHGSGAFVGTGAKGGLPRPIFVLPRGDVTKPGKQVQPGSLSAIAGLDASLSLTATASDRERRVALAQWLASDANPLTWRSIVNRVWQYHFGRGLVDTPNDFGHMGQLPSHPELLDWLAVEFRDGGGSLKALHRLICTSAAYRQSSTIRAEAAAIDADNALLWRANRRKLEAEAVRDSILSVAGKLDLTMGGPSFQDFVMTHPEHSPHYEYQLADIEAPALQRRSIYRFIVRSQQQPFMAALDCADPSMLVDKRNQSLSPLQALAMLNDRLTVVMSKHFAQRCDAVDGDLAAKVSAAFRLAMSRAPSDAELVPLTAYAQQHGLPNACRLVFNMNEFVFVD
jgi:mono/diheme cytochrome c family protein